MEAEGRFNQGPLMRPVDFLTPDNPGGDTQTRRAGNHPQNNSRIVNGVL